MVGLTLLTWWEQKWQPVVKGYCNKKLCHSINSNL